MIRFAFLFGVALLTAGIANAPLYAAERNYSLFGFSEIRVGNGIDVEIVTGKSASARAEADDLRKLDRLALNSGGDVLTVTLKRSVAERTRSDGSDTVKLYLTTREVDRISVTGSGDVRLDRLSGRNPYARVGGFGSLAIRQVGGDRLTIKMAGGGKLTIAGKVPEADIELYGSSSLDAGSLEVERLELTHRGPAQSRIAAKDQADINNSGNGMIEILGRPACQIRDVSGAEIICNPERR